MTIWTECQPKVKGIFLDVMPNFNTNGYQNYYGNITSFIHSKGLSYSYGNPGDDLLQSYQGKVDLLNIYEGYPGDSNPNDAQLTNSTLQGNDVPGNPPNWHTLNEKSTYSFLRYNQSSISQHMVQNASVYVGLEYFTDDGTPTHTNPWDKIATYLTNMVSYLSNKSVLSTIQAQNTAGNAVAIKIQIYQSGNLVRNATTPFIYNSTSGWQFKFYGSTVCNWIGSSSNHSSTLYVSPTSSGVYTAINGTGC